MPDINITFTITRIPGVAVTRLRVGGTDRTKQQIEAFPEASVDGKLVREGSFNVFLASSKATIEWDAVGTPNYAGTVNFKVGAGNKVLNAQQEAFVLNDLGRANVQLQQITII
jgi:hypothetical protein